jgi:hypothetical protein
MVASKTLDHVNLVAGLLYLGADRLTKTAVYTTSVPSFPAISGVNEDAFSSKHSSTCYHQGYILRLDQAIASS